MYHSFNTDIAERCGIEAAILLENIFFWCKKNEANDRNYNDGLYWTYNSVKAYGDLFPYMSKSKINAALKLLEESGYIKTGNYNDNKYDHTLWYAVTPAGAALIGDKKQKSKNDINNSIYENKKSNVLKSEISITDNKPYINTDIEGAASAPAPAEKERHVSYLKKLPIGEQYELVKRYAAEKGLAFDAVYFVDWWTSRNWTPSKGTRPLTDWQAAARTWAKKEQEYKRPAGNRGNIYGTENDCADRYDML